MLPGLRMCHYIYLANDPPPSSSKSKRADWPFATRSPSFPTQPEPFICPICFDDPQTTHCLSCDHPFCTSCWSAYITSKIRDEGEIAIQCMAEGCSLIASDPFVERVLTEDADTWASLQELVVRDFVASDPNLKYCPYPSCTYTASKSALRTVSCGGPRRKFFWLSD